MNEPHDRLQSARRSAGFPTASDAARHFRWNENTYRSHENGERGLKAKTAQVYAKAFGIDAGWLLLGLATHKTQQRIPLSGWIGREGRITLENLDEGPDVFLPVGVRQDAKVYRFADSSMYPRYAEGDLVICWTSNFDPEDDSSECVIDVNGAGLRFGTLSGNVADGFTIEFTGAKPLRNVDVNDFYPIELVVRCGRYDTYPYEGPRAIGGA